MCGGGGGSPRATRGEGNRVSVASRRGSLTERPVIKNVLDGARRAGLISVLPQSRSLSPAASPELPRFQHLNFRPRHPGGIICRSAPFVPAPRTTGGRGHDACKSYLR